MSLFTVKLELIRSAAANVNYQSHYILFCIDHRIMFTADLGELFSNVGSGSLSHSTNTITTAITTTHTGNNAENIRNPASLTPSIISGSSPAKQSTLVLSGVSKTSFLSSSTAALEDLFSSEYEISTKASHMNSTSHSLGPNTKAQPQTTRLPIASNDGAPIAESVANVGISKQPTLTTAPNRGALRCPVCDKASAFAFVIIIFALLLFFISCSAVRWELLPCLLMYSALFVLPVALLTRSREIIPSRLE